jgi:hypothetical protein
VTFTHAAAATHVPRHPRITQAPQNLTLAAIDKNKNKNAKKSSSIHNPRASPVRLINEIQ